LKISLILPTIQTEKDQLFRFLDSILVQGPIAMELIIIDQNNDERVSDLIREYHEKFSIIHLHSSRGLSHGRNVGLQTATGDVVAFPDDDCWYPEGLFETILRRFQENPLWDGICGCVRDEKGQLTANKWDKSPGFINRYSVWTRAVSISIFLRSSVLARVGVFDETLGAGAPTPWQSGEETDYLIRALAGGSKLMYLPELVVNHPSLDPRLGLNQVKAYQYALGMGRVLRKHHYPILYVSSVLARTALRIVREGLSGNSQMACYIMAIFSGRIHGYLQGGN